MSEVQPVHDPIMEIQIRRDQLTIDSRFGVSDSPSSQRTRDEIYSIAEKAGIDADDLYEITFEPEGWRDRLKFNKEQK